MAFAKPIVELKTFTPEGPSDRYAMTDVFVDDQGNITTTGTFYWYFTEDFIIDGTDVVRFSPDLELMWSAQFPGSGVQERQQVVVDAVGNKYVEASFRGGVGFTFDPTNDIDSLGFGYNSYVAALDDAGNWQWTTVFYAGDMAAARIGLVVDAAGNVFTAGAFSGTASLGENFPLESAGDADTYVVQIDSTDGSVVGAWRTGGAARDLAGSIAVDAAGTAYVQLSVESAIADSPMGAVLTTGEYVLTFRSPTSHTPGDANGDGHVDRADVAVIAANLGISENAERSDGDVDSDGRVSLADIAIVQQHIRIDMPAPAAVVASAVSSRRTTLASAVAARFRANLPAIGLASLSATADVLDRRNDSRRASAYESRRWEKAVDRIMASELSPPASKLRIGAAQRRSRYKCAFDRPADNAIVPTQPDSQSASDVSQTSCQIKVGRRAPRR